MDSVRFSLLPELEYTIEESENIQEEFLFHITHHTETRDFEYSVIQSEKPCSANVRSILLNIKENMAEDSSSCPYKQLLEISEDDQSGFLFHSIDGPEICKTSISFSCCIVSSDDPVLFITTLIEPLKKDFTVADSLSDFLLLLSRIKSDRFSLTDTLSPEKLSDDLLFSLPSLDTLTLLQKAINQNKVSSDFVHSFVPRSAISDPIPEDLPIESAEQFIPKDQSSDPDNTVKSKKEGCYIATAVYGSYNAPEVIKLRCFRDHTLKKTAVGRGFIRCYYRVSPPAARYLQSRTRLNTLVRKLLDHIVSRLP